MAEKGVETKLDTSVLNAEQQEKLRQFKIKTRIDNEKYMRAHPEVEVLVGDFLREILLKRPADIREFAADAMVKEDMMVVGDSQKDAEGLHVGTPKEEEVISELQRIVIYITSRG